MSKKQQYLNLNNFEKLDFIGKGGFSEVFKIQEKKTGKALAAKISIKRLNVNTKEIKELKMNLTREVNIIARLKNPCIIQYIGYSPTDFNDDQKPVIVTRYYKYGSLERIINLNRLEIAPKLWNDTKKLINIYGIASGVSYLHSRDILHRDLKPQNILEDENLFPAIADFGLAQVSHQKQDGTIYQPHTKTMGTPVYLAPEIWKKNAYSAAGDVYAFSLIVYEIMTNEIPLKGFDQEKIFEEVIQNHHRPEFKCQISESYRQLIEKCWLDNPVERPNFDSILTQLKNDPGFITKNVNKDEFFDYVEFIDQFHSSRDKNQRIYSFEEIKEQRKNKKAAEEKVLQLSIQEEEQQSPSNSEMDLKPILRPGLQKQLTQSPPKQKKLKKKKKINNKPNNFSLSNIQGFLDFSEETQQLIKQIVDQQKLKEKQIDISSENTLLLYKKGTFCSSSLVNFLKYFDEILIEVPYPSNFFELLLYSVSNLKKNKISRIKIVINILQISSIDNSAFYGCSFVFKINIPSSVKTIGNNAFHDCSSLSQITIPPSVVSIGDQAFSGCSSLKQIDIPPSVKSIGKNCFCGCSSLSQVPKI